MIIKDALIPPQSSISGRAHSTTFRIHVRQKIEDAIAGIWQEATRDEFLWVSQPSFSLQPGDKFYSYATSFGGGSLVVRDGKVVYNANTYVY